MLSFDEYGVYLAASLAEELGLRPYPLGTDGLKRIMDKRQFRQWCSEREISCPRYLAEGQEYSKLNYPLVVKPSPGAGSVLVKLCRTEEEVVEHIKECGGKIKENGAIPASIVVEEYIGGG